MRLPLILLAGLTLAGGAGAAEPAPAKKVPQHLTQARRDAARQTYEAFLKNNREGLLPLVEPAFRWSRRWMKAERDLGETKDDRVAAVQGHLRRMQDLERITRERFRSRVVPVEEASAVEFYRAEAETWLFQEKEK